MNKSDLVPYVNVIRSIESASTAELRAIARVEQAVLRQRTEKPAQAAAKVFDARQARREAAKLKAAQGENGAVEAEDSITLLEKALERNTRATAAATGESKTNRVASAQQAVAATQSVASAGSSVQYRSPVEISPVDDSEAAADQLSATEETNTLIKGLWMDEQKRWRQENGAFATRKQKEAVTGTQSNDETPKDRGVAAKLLDWVSNKLTEKNDNEAVDAAGVAVGSSYWLAGKEAAQMARSAKEFVATNKLNSKKNIKEKVSGAWTTLKNPKSWFSAKDPEQDKAEEAKKEENTAPPAPVSAKSDMPTQSVFQKFRNAFFKRIPDSWRKGVAGGKSQVTDNTAIHSVNQSNTGAPLNAQSIRQQDAKKDAITSAIEEQTVAFTISIDKTTAAIEALKMGGDSGPGLLESAADFLGRRKKKGRKGRGANRSSKRTPRRMGSYSGMGTGSNGSRGRPAYRNRAGAAAISAGRMGAYSGTTAAAGGVATAGKAGGIMGKLGGAARMGGAVLSKLALPLTIAMAAFDGVSGYNDKEGQKRTFGLQEGQEATTGQKSAMAAGSVLSAGGLTEMLFGVSGDDIAKTLYDFFSDGDSVAKSTVTAASPTPVATAQSTTSKSAPEIQSQADLTAYRTRPYNELDDFEKAQRRGNGNKYLREKKLAEEAAKSSKSEVPASIAAAQPAAQLLASEPKRPAEQKPTVVVAQLDPQSLKALEASRAPAATQEPSTPKNAQTIKMQSDKIGTQIPLAASDEHMRLQALDRA
jgi:hypothetical protein